MDFVDRTIDRKVNFQKLTFVKIDFLKLTFVKNWLLSSPMVVGSPLRSWTGENLTVPWFLKLCFFLEISKFLKIVKIVIFFGNYRIFENCENCDFFVNYRIFDLVAGFGWRICREDLPWGFVNFSLFLVRTPTSVVSCVSRSLNIPRIIWVPKRNKNKMVFGLFFEYFLI